MLRAEEVPLLGRFNLINVMASAAVGLLLGASPDAIREAVIGFRPLPHRLERLGTFAGIDFIDDSIATIPDATLGAVEALEGAVQTLILGGHERNLDFGEFGRRVSDTSVDNVILFDPAGARIWDAIKSASGDGHPRRLNGFRARDMAEAVALAFALTDPGRACLLSPAAASYGMFKDFADRGERFALAVREYADRPAPSAGVRLQTLNDARLS